MATTTAFLVRFKEFAGVDSTQLAAELAAATLEIDPVIWGALTDEGIYYTLAHRLALSPYGNSAKLSTKGMSTYGVHLDRLMAQVTAGVGRVT